MNGVRAKGFVFRAVLGVWIGASWAGLACADGEIWDPTAAPEVRLNRLQEQLREQKLARKKRIEGRMRAGQRTFVDKNGVTTFTDKPERYANDPRYTEVIIPYEPIVVSRKYKGRTTAAEYTDSDIADIVRENARRYGVDENLIYAVIRVESNFNPSATSSKGASGLMQLMPGTAREMGVKNINNPAENIAGGTQYLSKLISLFKGNVKHALAGYNAGPRKVRKYGGIPPYRETQNYVRDVLRYREQYRRKGVGSVLLAKADKAVATKPALKPNPKPVIHFHSGLKQEVDRIVPEGEHYFVELKGRTFKIPKRIVKEVDEDA